MPGLKHPAFATDLIHQKGWNGVKIWVFGHTHYSTTLQRNGIRLVANQRGYVLPGNQALNDGPKAKSNHEFDATKIVNM